MPAEKALALVLSVIEFSETSYVVRLFTREFGKVHALAKGARRPKGPFEGALDLACLCRVVFLRKSSDALDLVTEARLERRFRVPGRDLSRLYAAYYVLELLNELTDRDDPHPELFDAAEATLAALPTTDSVARLTLRWEITALRLLGHSPSLDACAECGTPLARAGRIAFSQAAGGALCRDCRPGKTQVVSLSAAASTWWDLLANPDPDPAAAAPLPRSVWGELRGLLTHYLSHLAGHPFHLHRYLTWDAQTERAGLAGVDASGGPAPA